MVRTRWLMAALTAAFLARGAAAAPLEAYGQLPSIEQVSISPDGQMLAIAVTNGEQRKVVIERISDRQIIANLNAGNQKVRDVSWGGPGHLLVTVSSTGAIMDIDSERLETSLATNYSLAAKSQRPLLVFPEDDANLNLNIVESSPTARMIGGKPFAFAEGTHFINGQGQLALFKVDLDRGETTTESRGLEHTNAYAIGPEGVLAESDYDAPSGQWTLRLWKGHWEVARRETAPIETPELMGQGREDGSVLVDFRENTQDVLRELPAGSTTWSDPLPIGAPDRLFRDGENGRLIGETALEGDDARYEFFAPQDQKVWKAIVAAYPGQRVGLAEYDTARDKFVVRVDSPTDGPAYALVDLAAKKASWIGGEYPGLKNGDIAPVRPVAFKARDGLGLTGYLALPQGKAEKALPLVVLVHGGPAARDDPGFDWWSQALASRGYAVLQVNYRGSAGLGWDFQAAGFGQWGRKMQTDLSDGVRYLAAQGVVDASRVCIVGASYGGYAALAGATLDTGLYRCAASVAGPADLAAMVNRDKAVEGRQGAATQRYWARYMGDLTRLDDISPAKHADKVSIPILLIHGKDDTVAPYEQSQSMAGALSRAGKPFEFVTLKAEDHWLSRGATRLQMLQAVAAFLEKNNPA